MIEQPNQPIDEISITLLPEQFVPVEVFTSVADLPFDVDSLSAEVKQYFKPLIYHNQRYLVVKVGDIPAGFSILDLPDQNSDSCIFAYRYVFPEMRRKGVGEELRIAAYVDAKQLGFKWVESGINDVIQVTENGDIKSVLNPGADGTWASYKSMNCASYPDGSYPVHEVDVVKVAANGIIDLSFRTNVQDTSIVPCLPGDPEELFRILQDQVLPTDLTAITVFQNAQSGEDVFAYRGKQALSFTEFFKQVPLVSRF